MLTVNVFNVTISTLSVFGLWLQGTHKEDLPKLPTNLTDTHRGLCSCPTDHLYDIRICPTDKKCLNATERVIYHVTPNGRCIAIINCLHPYVTRMQYSDGHFWDIDVPNETFKYYGVCKNGEWFDTSRRLLHVVCYNKVG
ncbi:unnamed protein product [Cylicocyclus nassatus]|uniref:Uncharacterized protein n=1 Tax=Cylicocyclus nassatus TaxID=53992 RepID=A0AA36GY59_CYLNA|nr:unnamed protein product [Cylicocyclus nassatus]